MDEISQNTKLEIAVEIIAAKIAKCSRDGYKIKDYEIKNLLKERDEMYKGNEEIIGNNHSGNSIFNAAFYRLRRQ